MTTKTFIIRLPRSLTDQHPALLDPSVEWEADIDPEIVAASEQESAPPEMTVEIGQLDCLYREIGDGVEVILPQAWV